MTSPRLLFCRVARPLAAARTSSSIASVVRMGASHQTSRIMYHAGRGFKWLGTEQGPGLATGPRRLPIIASLDAVIHLELDRVRGVLEGIDLAHLELEIGVDEVVAEHVALLQEGAVAVEAFERLPERAAHRRHLLQKGN